MAEDVKDTKLGTAQKSLSKFYKDVRSELKKVIWPTKIQLANNTLTVFSMCLLIGLLIAALDWGLLELSKVVFKAS